MQLIDIGECSLGSGVFLPLPWHSHGTPLHSLAELQTFDSWSVPLSISSSIQAQHLRGSSMAKDGWVQTAGAAEANSAPPGPVAAAAAYLAAAAAAAASESMPSAPASSWLTLGALTALTCLVLWDISIEGCCDVCAWLASQLAHLPRLRGLSLGVFHKAPYTSAGAAALASRLQQLQGLTSLHLGADEDHEPRIPCPPLIRLTQLSSLDLENIGTSGQPLDLGTLPGSLTALRFRDCDISYADTSSSGHAVQLPLLQKLDVYMTSPASNLQHLCLLLRQASALSNLMFIGDCRSFLDRASGVLPQLQSLQHIQLHNPRSWGEDSLSSGAAPEAAHHAALTSSSQLTSLELGRWRWSAGAVQHMFPARHQLQRLQTLCVPFTAGWDLEPGDISCIVACCPNLRCLAGDSYLREGAVVDVGRISTTELQQLRQLTALSTLSIGSPCWDTAAATELADLTGGCMAVTCYVQPRWVQRAQLPKARQLLLIHAMSQCDDHQLIGPAAV
jgi:hypothetical protein